MKPEKATLTGELRFLLEKGNAHVSFEEAVAGIPEKLRTTIPGELPYSIWQLVEHIRITQWDIVEFCMSAKHVSPDWPKGYWPAKDNKVSDKEWEVSLEQIRADRDRFMHLIEKKDASLDKALPHGNGQSLLREALLIADHTAYHTAEIVVLRRLLHCWP